ncbi:MAG: glycosyltransferase, partial [Tepidisphaeraceae bacterium]
LVLIEAMSLGVPVVATDVPGIRDVVQDGVNGLLVPVGSPAKLAVAIRRIATDHNLRFRVVENGLRIVRERFSWEVVLPRYRELLSI